MNSSHLNNEAELLIRISRGDEQAFQTLVHFYSDRVFFHALTFVKTWHQAEEISQDIFLHIWQKRDKLADVKNFEGYLFIISKNFLLSFMRKKVRDFNPAEIDRSAELIPRAATELEGKELGGLIEKAIDHLPDQKRQVFRMIHQEGLSQEDVARKLNIATRTVRWNLVSATNGIKDFLKRYSISEFYVLFLVLSFY